MIATAIEPAVGHPLPGNPYFASQRVRVLDSAACPAGKTVLVYVSTAHMRGVEAPKAGVPLEGAGGLPVGQKVLLFARKSVGSLRIPNVSDYALPDLGSVALQSRNENAFLGEAYFLTSRSRLETAESSRWRALASIAVAIPATGDGNAYRIAKAIPYLYGRGTPSNYGQPDDRFSILFAHSVGHDSAYHRALVDAALNELRYWGYRDRFSRDLREAATDPAAFPDGIPILDFDEEPGTGNNPSLPKDFRHDPPVSQAEVLRVLFRAKNPTLAAAFLQALSTKPSMPDIKLLSRFLDSPDPRLRRAFVERLAAWNGEPAPPEAKEVIGSDGTPRMEYPGLEAAVARWKARLKAQRT